MGTSQKNCETPKIWSTLISAINLIHMKWDDVSSGWFHCIKNVRIRTFSCPYFPAFALNKERYRYGVSLSVFSPNAEKHGIEKLRIRALFTQCLFTNKLGLIFFNLWWQLLFGYYCLCKIVTVYYHFRSRFNWNQLEIRQNCNITIRFLNMIFRKYFVTFLDKKESNKDLIKTIGKSA